MEKKNLQTYRWSQWNMIDNGGWASEILHQLVDGLSPQKNPIIYSVS